MKAVLHGGRDEACGPSETGNSNEDQKKVTYQSAGTSKALRRLHRNNGIEAEEGKEQHTDPLADEKWGVQYCG